MISLLFFIINFYTSALRNFQLLAIIVAELFRYHLPIPTQYLSFLTVTYSMYRVCTDCDTVLKYESIHHRHQGTGQVFTAGIHAELNLSQLIAVIIRPSRMKSELVHVDGHFCSFFDIGIMPQAVNGD